jgi:hypothetical protein
MRLRRPVRRFFPATVLGWFPIRHNPPRARQGAENTSTLSEFFGVARKGDCVADVFYGSDYPAHPGTRRGDVAVTAGGAVERISHDTSTKYPPRSSAVGSKTTCRR